MTLDEFVERFAEEFDQTPVESFKPDTCYTFQNGYTCKASALIKG